MNHLFFRMLDSKDVIKFVIADEDEYILAKEKALDVAWQAHKVFSPMIEDQKDYTGWPQELANLMIKDAEEISPKISYSLQIHKVLWPYSEVER